MVQGSEEGMALCIIRDVTTTNQCSLSSNKITLMLPASTTVQQMLEEVAQKYQYAPNTFELILQKNSHSVILNDLKDKTIEEVGFEVDETSRNRVVLADMANSMHKCPIMLSSGETNEDDLILGASASPTAAGDYITHDPPNPPPLAITAGPSHSFSSYRTSVMNKETGYVGLVNQAMTCYLNSLLQALFMTPEFRNAMYNWQFKGLDSEESKSIPYQLQKLFLNLQTSDKTAVETTELTRSFGWDSSEAWQQHDIQELCRVMFDALEQTFKNTQQADLILSLYEGKMIDYVKCLECGTEKSREDTFLDIPLPVRPFGSAVAYGSVEEALRAFVQPETLDGNNQYHCEKCAKKCDAHKGLKFSKFPYLLTLHLKRFDFDYSTLHRIKLNDKVAFPETLNLNSFVASATGCKEESECSTAEETVVKNDDSSTTDSGSALDDEAQLPDSVPATILPSSHDAPDYDDDEGIDCSNGPNHQENEKNRLHTQDKGPYMYELFSIMIHSGSASGGHYYAYIKDFTSGEWYCYNDQSVSRITNEDITKTYGGGPLRAYYSGAYSSSTNAYMLMYRQIDKERNCEVMSVDELPPHIQELLHRVKETEETDRMMREKEMDMCKLKLYAHHPTQNQVVESKLYCMNDVTLVEATELAYKNLLLEGLVPLDRCRLVNYDRLQDSIECSFEDRDSEHIGDILASLTCNYKYDLLLEIRKENAQFEVYQPGGVTTKVFVVDVATQEVDGPTMVRGNLSQTVAEFKVTLAKALSLDAETIKVVLEKYNNEPRLLDNEEHTLKFEGFYGSNKIFVASSIDEDPEKPFIVSKLHQIIDRFEHIITLHMSLPDTDKETLEKLAIPVAVNGASPQMQPSVTISVSADCAEVPPSPSHPPRDSSPLPPRDSSPQPIDGEDEGLNAAGQNSSDQSNSEDSSLTDSERTLVGDLAHDEGLAQMSSPSNSSPGSDQQNISSPDDAANILIEAELSTPWDDDDDGAVPATRRCVNYYFKSTPYVDNDDQKMLKVLVDKRMNLGNLKRCVEPFVGVPLEYFKIYRIYAGQQEFECSRLNESLSSYRDDERLSIKIGRALRKGEHIGKIYQLLPNAPEPSKFLCDWILGDDSTIGEAKREILAELKQKYSIDIPVERCRLRKKNWKNPSKVHLDDQKLNDISLFDNWELFLQELPEPEPVTSPNQMVLFVRRWRPSTLELQPFNEVLLDSSTVDELKQKLSELSGIPLENVEVAKAQGSFPCETTSVLSIQTELEWNVQAKQLANWPLNIAEDGHVIYYRDSTEELKQLSPEERKELTYKEGSRSNRYFSRVCTFSPRKERALKIYLDTSPKKEETDQD